MGARVGDRTQGVGAHAGAVRFQLAHGPFAADHDVAVPILGDRRDEAFRHAVGGGVDAELAARETRHDAVARGPDASVARFEQRARVIAHQTVRRGERGDLAVAQPVQPAAVGADPQRTVRGRKHRGDGVRRQAFARGDDGEARVAELVEPVVRSDPEAAFRILEERRDDVVREAVASGEGIEALAAHAHETAAARADPEVAVPIRADRERRIRGESLGLAEGRDAVAVDARQPATRRDPDVSGGVLIQAVDEMIRQQLALDAERFGLDPGHFQHAARGRDPQASGSIFQDRADDVSVHQETAEPPVLEAAEAAAARADPERAVATAGDGSDLPARSLFVRRVRFRAIRLEGAVLQTDEPAGGGADPQAAVRVFQEGRDAAVAKRRRIRAAENREADAVEPRQAAPRAQPEVSVAGLNEGTDRILRQAVARQPHVQAVLRDAPGGIQGMRSSSLQAEKPAEQKSRNSDRRPSEAVHCGIGGSVGASREGGQYTIRTAGTPRWIRTAFA